MKGMPRRECIRDGEHGHTIKVDIEDRKIELGRFGEFDRLANLAGSGSHRIAEVGEHVLKKHTDQDFVFNDEDAVGCQRTCP